MCTRVHQNGALDRFGYPRIVMALVGQEFDVLRIEIIGNLGSDPEQRSRRGQLATAAAPTAKVSSGQTGSARAMGSKAEYVSRFTKGQRVLVVGRLEIGEWQTHEGESRVSYAARG